MLEILDLCHPYSGTSPATFQEPDIPMWLVAIVLDTSDPETWLDSDLTSFFFLSFFFPPRLSDR